MPLQYPLVHVDAVRPKNMKEGELALSQAVSAIRIPIVS